ncbi:MAG: hypothetical protein AAGF11_15655 [Myxococcota bacterium]
MTKRILGSPSTRPSRRFSRLTGTVLALGIGVGMLVRGRLDVTREL